MILLPQHLLTSENFHRSIDLDGCTIIESCFYDDKYQESAYLAEHEMIHVLSGQLRLVDHENSVVVNAGETVLIRKGTYFEFIKLGRLIQQEYKSVLFFLHDTFIKEFVQMYRVESKEGARVLPAFVKLEDRDTIKGFVYSLLPYFNSPIGNKREFLRLKTYELLFNLAEYQPGLFSYFFHITHPSKADLVQVMEKYFTKNLTLDQYAELSGRSLSTFKRDFQKVFKTSPSKWIKEKRLELSKHLLENTNKKPTEVYLEVGFESYPHFSRSFKEHFSLLPSELTTTH